MRLFLFLILFLFAHISIAQRTSNKLNLKGTVLGYDHDPTKGFFKKNQTNELQGSLGDVSITIFEGSKKIKSLQSNSGGEFSVGLKVGSKYTLQYSKKGYGTSAIIIDLREIPEKLAKQGLLLDHIEFILNDYESDKPIDNGEAFGTIYFDASESEFKFEETIFDEKKRLFKKDETNTPLNVITNSISKNKEHNIIIDGNNTTKNGNNTTNGETTETVEITENTTTPSFPSLSTFEQQKINRFKSFSGLTNQDILSRESEIKDAWTQLEKDKLVAVTEEDFLLIKAREELLFAAEKELEAARSFIAEQDEKLSAQQRVIYLFIGIAILLAALGFMLYKGMREKQKSNLILAAKNKKINDSILYAERIQKSVLISESQISSMLPNAMVFYKPLDVVSGDFYWFTEVNNTVIFAAVDCTGHGVPGAFMSLIGNTLLNQIVKEKKITKPGEILSALHAGIVDALHQSGNKDLSDDGMDMALCSLNKSTLKLTFSGAMNPVYIVNKNEVKELSGNLQGIGGTVRNKVKREFNFGEEEIQLEKNDGVYLFSDGFMDQFGGTTSEKFNVRRFKDLLVEINEMPPGDQKGKLEKAFNDWKGNENQIDDVLVVGAKI